MTTGRQWIIGVLMVLAVFLAGYAAASPHNLKISLAFASMVLLTAAFFMPRVVIFAWVLGAMFLMSLWHNTVASRLSIHAATSLLLCLLLLARWVSKREPPTVRWWEFGWPLFGIVSVLSAMRGSSEFSLNPTVITTSLLFPFAFYVFGKEFFRDKDSIKILALCLVLLSIPMAFIGYYEYTMLVHLWEQPKEYSVISAVGPYGSPNRYGLMQVVGFFMALYLFRSHFPRIQRAPFRNLVWVLVLLLLGYSALLSSSRGLIVGFAIAIIYNLYRMQSRLVGVLLAVLLIAGVGFNADKLLSETFLENKMTVEDDSTKRRVAQWMSALRIFADKPLFGVGYQYFANPNRVDEYVTHFGGVSSRGRLIHNSPLDILARSGLAGLVPYVVFLTGLGVSFVRLMRRNKGDPMGYFALMVFSIFIAQQLLFMTVIDFYSEILNATTLLLYGAAVGYHQATRVVTPETATAEAPEEGTACHSA